MKRSTSPHASVSLAQSVRTRLTLWYLAIMAFIIWLFGGSLYATQTFFNTEVAESTLQTHLYQDTQHFAALYQQALLSHQTFTELQLNQPSQEMVLLLRPDGSVLDARGPLTSNLIQQLQISVKQNAEWTDLALAQNHSSHNWWARTTTYRVLMTPVLNQNARIAILLVGLPHQSPVPFLAIWLFWGILALLIAALGGYWLSGKALHPVKMITQMANEINATDLRHRLHLKRRDEFGALAATFDQMLARLEAAFKRQTQFTADASHELRTPLTIIALEINRALTQLPPSAAYRQVLEHIQAENEQMIATVTSLLLLAQADTGRFEFHPELVDLGDITLGAVERLLPVAQQYQITLSTGALPELLVIGDPQYLTRTVTNLVENGIKYTRGIGTRVHVELTDEQGRWGVIRVQDDGPGIAEEHLPYLFDRFYRVDHARTHNLKERTSVRPNEEGPGGTGLGLSIVQWIVQAHGGEVRVKSEVRRGSLFEVRLPLQKPQMTD